MPNPPVALETVLRSGAWEEILAALLAAFQAEAGTIHLWRAGSLQLVSAARIPAAVLEVIQTVPIGKGMAGLAAERGEPVTICNLQEDASGQVQPGARLTGMEGAIAVPMLFAGELCGVIGLAKASAYDWSVAETELLLRYASLVGAAVPGSSSGRV